MEAVTPPAAHPKNKRAQPGKPKQRLPRWAWWLVGYALVLAGAAFLAYAWRVLFFLDQMPALPFTLGLMGLFSLLYAALFLVCQIKGAQALCMKAALCVFGLGLLYCFATAPLQAPDEQSYFLRANSISRGVFAYQAKEDYPRDADLLVENFFPAGKAPLNHRVQYQGAEMAPLAFTEYRGALVSGAAADTRAQEPLLFMLLPFLHQGLFMAAARLAGFSALGQLYAARLANLLVYSLLCYVTFRNAERFRGLFFAFSLLPVSLFMAASCSYDALALALCFFALSVVCKSRIEPRHAVLFIAAVMLANYIKPLNFMLAFVLLLAPRQNWKIKLKPWVVCAGALVLALGFWLGMGRIDRALSYAGGWARPEDLPRGSGDNPNQEGQLAFMLRAPLRFIAVALQSMYEADGFLFDLGRLGFMDLVLPLVGGLSAACLVAAAALAVRPREDTSPLAMAALAAIALCYCAGVLAGMYVADTDLYSIRVTGQQPRYFLPAFLMLFTLFSILLGKLLQPRARWRDKAATPQAVTLWMCAAVGLVGAVLLFQNYFVGQWIPKAEGGWKLVNLFGWVQS